jgi:hypothetical protein
MYTIQFGSRAHFLTDDAAETVRAAIAGGELFVTVPIDLSGDGLADYEVTLNVAHIVALIRHPHQTPERSTSQAVASERPRLVLVG